MTENNIQKIEEALKTSKLWKFENATLDFDVNINKYEYSLESVCYTLARLDGYINRKVNDVYIEHWRLPKCKLFRIYYELRDEQFRVYIYRFHKPIGIKIQLFVNVKQGIISLEQVNYFEP